MKIQSDAKLIHLIHKLDEGLNGPSQAVYRPAGDEVESASVCVFDEGIKLWAFGTIFGTRDAFIAVAADDFPSTSLGNLPEFKKLIFDGLIRGADAAI